MYKYYNPLQNKSGDALPGYYVRLFTSAGAEVDIFADNSGTPIVSESGVANAAKSDSLGMVRFYVPNGTYDILMYDQNDTYVATEAGVPIYDASGLIDDLAADTGAASIGTDSGDTVQEELDAKVAAAALAADTGAGLVGYKTGYSGAAARTVQAAMRDFGVNVADFGANPANADNRAAIQAAINTGAKRVYFPSGSYYCDISGGPITSSTDQQQLIGLGDVNIFRDGNGQLFTSSAGDLLIENISFWGQSAAQSYTGDLVVLTGARARLVRCACRDAGADLVLKVTGTRSKIEGDKDGYYGKVQIGASGAVCLYPHVSSVYISETLTMVETGAGKVEGGVIAGITVEPGAGGGGSHGPKIAGTRIVGNLNVRQTFTTICGGTTVSGNVVVGDGSNAISNICFDPTFDQAAGSFTINANVSQSVFFLGAVVDAGLTLTINSPVNQIWHPPLAYTPTLSASGGSPSLGNGAISGTIARYGYERRVAIQLSVGSTTDLGSGSTRVSVPDTSGSSGIASGAGRIFDSGVGHKPIITEISPTTGYMVFYSSTTGGAFGGQTVDSAFPITFANGDAILASASYSVK